MPLRHWVVCASIVGPNRIPRHPKSGDTVELLHDPSHLQDFLQSPWLMGCPARFWKAEREWKEVRGEERGRGETEA